MAKKQEIDRLTQEANAALAANMSYGKYKALQKAEPIKKVPALLYDGRRGGSYHPEREMVCTVCGKVYVGRNPKRLYCGEVCKGRATRERMKIQKELAQNQGGENNA